MTAGVRELYAFVSGLHVVLAVVMFADGLLLLGAVSLIWVLACGLSLLRRRT